MAGILAATMLGLVYLTQTLGATATSGDIRSLEKQIASLRIDVGRQVIMAPDDADVITFAREQGRLRALPDRVLKAP